MWRIHIRLAEVSDDASLVRDMVNLSDNTRMLAVASVAVLAANEATLLKKRDNLNSPVRLHQKNVSLKENSRSVSDELVKELCRLLEDPALHVRVPSAITLYCMEKKSDKVRAVSLILHVSCMCVCVSGSNRISSCLGKRGAILCPR